MKKNILLTLIALLSVVSAYAADEVKIGDLYYNLDSSSKTATVSGTSINSGDITIPSSIMYEEVTYSVTSIGISAFERCTGITSITIPNCVTSIGEWAFSTCTGLTSITIPNSVTSIGEWAFSTCTGLTSITIPNSVTSIGKSAFSTCTGLTSITIPNSVTSIGMWAFAGCSGLTSFTIPNSVTSIGVWAFAGCTGLTSVTIPNSVTSIGNEAFEDVPNVVFNGTATGSPWGARSVNGYVDGYLVYADATKTTLLACSSAATGAITIPNSVTSIGSSAFYYCAGLTSITIPNSVTSIGDYAFYYCTGLTSITVPESVTSIGGYAFCWCTGLTSVTIGNSVTSIGNDAFNGCTGLTSITIPNSVTSIGQYALAGCTSLTSITIPESVTSIGNLAFYDVPNVVYNGTATGSPWGARNVNGYVDGYLVYADATKTTLLACSRAATGVITIPNSVTSIGSSAFSGCTGLTSVTIGNSVTSIGNDAFNGCTGLTSVTIPNSVTSIGQYALAGCTSLSSITLPNNITSIDGTFSGCTSLTSITLPNSVTSIGYHAFWACTGLTSITIPNSVTSVGEDAFYQCTGLTSVVWNAKHCNGWSYYTEAPFYSVCGNITSFAFGNEVDSIPYAICDNMWKLRSITIPESVTHIGGSAFYGCRGLTSVTIPESVTSIGNYAFSRCTGLTSIQVAAQTPPQCSDQSFYNVPNDIPVIILCGTKEAYQAADGWSAFTNIIEEHDYAVAIQSSNENYGTATIVSYTCGNELTIQATANEHYHFTQWSDGSTDNPRTFVVVQDTALTAIFAPKQYSISVSSEYGSVQGAGKYDYGTTATLTAIADEHYCFDQWNDGNTDNPRTVSVEGDATYTAVFAPNQYTISSTAENGRVEGTGKYDYGTTATLTAIANEHYHFVRWSDGNTDNPRTITIEGDATYTAEFAIDQFTVTATCDIMQGVVSGGGVFEYGTQASVQAFPNSGYEFKQWSNGQSYNPYRFAVVSDLTLEAEFIPATAIDNISADTDTTTPQKVLINGQVYILRNGKTYTTTGVEVE